MSGLNRRLKRIIHSVLIFADDSPVTIRYHRIAYYRCKKDYYKYKRMSTTNIKLDNPFHAAPLKEKYQKYLLVLVQFNVSWSKRSVHSCTGTNNAVDAWHLQAVRIIWLNLVHSIFVNRIDWQSWNKLIIYTRFRKSRGGWLSHCLYGDLENGLYSMKRIRYSSSGFVRIMQNHTLI